jgi:nicotinamidase-related amidase
MDPRSVALLLVGFQNDKFSSDSPIRGFVEQQHVLDGSLARTVRFVQAIADLPTLLISTPIEFEDDEASRTRRPAVLTAIREMGLLKSCSVGADTIPQLAALGDRIITVRNRSGFNAFSQTTLEDTLRAHGIRHVLIAGSFTSMCVDSSGRAAFDLGFDVTILTDCIVGRTKFEDDFYCSSIFPLYANTATSDEILERLRGSVAD